MILLVLALPTRSGLEVLERLKERQPYARDTLIIVRAYAMLLLVGDYARHASGAVRKPMDLKQLLNHINSLLRPAQPRFRLLPPTELAQH